MAKAKPRSFKAVSIVRLTDLGYEVDDGERPIPGTKWKKDLFGFGDLIGFDDAEVLLVQYTARGDVNRRVGKILASPAARRWLSSPGRAIEVWGWYDFRKYHKVRLSLEDFPKQPLP
jgi:hypothetical protein